MDLYEITDEYNAIKNSLEGKYRSLYEEELIKLLKNIGMFDTDVKQISTGKTGKLKIFNGTYNSINSEIRFAPYTAKGELSKNTKPIYYYVSKIENVKSAILKDFAAAEENG